MAARNGRWLLAPIQWSILKQSCKIMVIVGANSMVNPESYEEITVIWDCKKSCIQKGDVKQWYAYHIWWSHALICLPHPMISHSDMPTTYNAITQWYTYHIWSPTVLCLPHMISHHDYAYHIWYDSDMPTTYDIMQCYAYHMICLPHMISHSDMPTTCDITLWSVYHIQWSHAVICLPHMMISHSDILTT